ncbi:MAG TPA: peptide deformylase, partial [Polyangiaceae bacterium]
EFQELVRKMIATMREAPGVGLAAPQIGIGKRVFVMEDQESYLANVSKENLEERERVVVPLRTIVNPVVKPVGKATKTFFEGCLSVEGYVALVPRFREVEVTGLDENAAPVKLHLKGWPARIVQHETDHLNGTLYVDRMITRSFGTVDNTREWLGKKSSADAIKALVVDPPKRG